MPNEQDALALAERIRSGETSASAALAASLARARACAELGAIRHIDAALGMAQAEALDRALVERPRRAAGRPFLGVPFLMKDLGAPAAGLPLTCGSALLRDAPAAQTDSQLAQRFRRAGLTLFGVTSVPEFGLSLATEPIGRPPARNPLDPRLTPGGSSGGAAAAVAAGIVAIAHATDAGGSIRVPAACCGLVGLKPTRGAIPGGPAFGNHLGGLASELVVARSLRDVAAALDCLAGAAAGPEPDPSLDETVADGIAASDGSLRIGLCSEDGAGFAVSDARRSAVEDAADVLRRAGHAIVPVPAAMLEPLLAGAALAFDRIIAVNLALNLRGLDAEAAGTLEPLTRAVIERGRALPGTELMEAERAMVRTAHGLWRLFERVDVLLTPMLTTAPPRLGAFPTDHADLELHWRRFQAFAPYAGLANAGGVPALTLPHGADPEGLPLPVQLIGPMGSDRFLLRLAGLLRAARPWTSAVPIAGLAP